MGPILPDLLRPGLAVVFCGTAAGAASARVGAYYAGPGNAFWRTLHEVGLTPERLAPAEFERLAELGIGLTDVCKVRSGSDAEVGRGHFDVAGLERRIATAAPSHLAFNGKSAGRAALGRAVAYGRQPQRFGGATTWVLPSTRARRGASGTPDRGASSPPPRLSRAWPGPRRASCRWRRRRRAGFRSRSSL